MRAARGIHADAVADRPAGAVVGDLWMELAAEQQHWPALGPEPGAVADLGVEVARWHHPPLAAGAEEHPVRLHVEVARALFAVELVAALPVLDVVADRLALAVEHPRVDREGD